MTKPNLKTLQDKPLQMVLFRVLDYLLPAVDLRFPLLLYPTAPRMTAKDCCPHIGILGMFFLVNHSR